MASKTQAPASAPDAEQPRQHQQGPELLEIGELRSKHKIGRAVFAGVCAAQSWKPGKLIAEDEFLAAVKAFTGAPMGGARSRKEAGA